MQLTNSTFYCSMCGCSVTRTVDADVQQAGGDVAFFCRQRCAQRHRTSGLVIMSAKIKLAIMEAVKNRWDDKYIAADLNVSLAAVQAQAAAYRRRLAPSTDDTRVNKAGRKRKVQLEEDDIFSPIRSQPTEQDRHEQRN